MSKHSPGPWVWSGGALRRVGTGDWVVSSSGTDTWLCVESANARLIAAAPEMLDLLRQFASEWDSFVRRNPELHEGDGLVQEDPFALKVRALLARIDED